MYAIDLSIERRYAASLTLVARGYFVFDKWYDRPLASFASG